MGSHNFEARSTIREAGKAYDDLVEQAVYEHGHDGYNGSISTTRGFRVVQHTPVSEAKARDIIHTRLENLNKWDACECIPVADDNAVPKRTFRVRVKEWTPDPQPEVLAKVKPGEVVVSRKIVADARTWRVRSSRAKGKRVVQYFVKMNGRLDLLTATTHVVAMREHEERIKAELIRRVQVRDNNALRGHPQFEVHLPVPPSELVATVTIDNGPLGTVAVDQKGGFLEVEVSVQGPFPAAPPFKEWIFYGWAAS